MWLPNDTAIESLGTAISPTPTRAATTPTNTRLQPWVRRRRRPERRFWTLPNLETGTSTTYFVFTAGWEHWNQHLAPNAVGRRRGFEACRKPFEAVSHCQPFPPLDAPTRRRTNFAGRPAQCRTSACAASAAGLPRARLLVGGCSPHAQSITQPGRARRSGRSRRSLAVSSVKTAQLTHEKRPSGFQFISSRAPLSNHPAAHVCPPLIGFALHARPLLGTHLDRNFCQLRTIGTIGGEGDPGK